MKISRFIPIFVLCTIFVCVYGRSVLNRRRLLNVEMSNAITNGRLPDVIRIYNEGGNVNGEDYKGNSHLQKALWAAGTARRVGVEDYYKKAIRLQKGYWAAQRVEDLKKLQFLLSHGANPNATDKSGNSPLFIAIFNGDAESVRALMNAGADSNQKVRFIGSTFANSPTFKQFVADIIKKILGTHPMTHSPADWHLIARLLDGQAA